MIERDVLAENLYVTYTETVCQASLQFPSWKHLTPSQRQRWVNVAEYVLQREQDLVHKGALKRAHKRIFQRIQERLQHGASQPGTEKGH